MVGEHELMGGNQKGTEGKNLPPLVKKRESARDRVWIVCGVGGVAEAGREALN